MKYIGTVLGGLIEIFIVFAVLNYYEFDNNQVIIASIIILYSSIRMMAINNGMIWRSYVVALDRKLDRIEDLITKKDEEDIDLENLDFDNTNNETKSYDYEEKFKIEDFKTKIRLGVIFIIYIIGFFGLLGNL